MLTRSYTITNEWTTGLCGWQLIFSFPTFCSFSSLNAFIAFLFFLLPIHQQTYLYFPHFFSFPSSPADFSWHNYDPVVQCWLPAVQCQPLSHLLCGEPTRSCGELISLPFSYFSFPSFCNPYKLAFPCLLFSFPPTNQHFICPCLQLYLLFIDFLCTPHFSTMGFKVAYILFLYFILILTTSLWGKNVLLSQDHPVIFPSRIALGRVLPNFFTNRNQGLKVENIVLVA